MPVHEYLLLALVSLFAIINPLSAVPAFLAMTPDESPASRIQTARLACLVAVGILLSFAMGGAFFFTTLGITMAAFQIAGGVLLFAIAFDMVRSPQADLRLTAEEKQAAREKDDIAITPLAVPLLCGPGAISTVIILQTQAPGVKHSIALYACIPVVYGVAFLVLKISSHGAAWLNPIVLRVLRRLMGLVFSAVAIQFVLSGIADANLFSPP
jgi:multiple antibiotic resistance protein